LKNESPDLTSILTSNKDPEGIQKGVYSSLSTMTRYTEDRLKHALT